MSPYWKFDLDNDLEPETSAKVAQVAKANTGSPAQTTTLAGLATLAAEATTRN
jgi:hypothetical protein